MGYALYKLSKEDATIFVKLTEKCWDGKERDLTKLNKYERAVLLKLMDKAGEYTPGEKPVKKYNDNHDPKTGRFAPKADTSYQGKQYGKAYGRGETADMMAGKLDKLPEKVVEANPEAIKQLKEASGNPNAKITIYRATVGDTINEGDWVFLERSLAEKWTKTPMGTPKKGCKVLTKEVAAKDVDWTGKNLEFAYAPQGVAKLFTSFIRKFNKYHDPKTGRFTSAPGGSSSGIMANIAPEFKADYDKDKLTYEMLGLDPAPLDDKYELLAVLNPGSKVNIGAMPDDLRKQTVATVKQFIDKYPMAKEAITTITVGDHGYTDTFDDDYFKAHPKTMAFYNRENGVLCLNPSLYDKKSNRASKFEEVYRETVESGYHPKGTDHTSVIVHEMAHAIDNYYSTTNKANFAAEVKREVSFYASKTKKDFSVNAQKTGLSEYAMVNEAEFFAEAIAEYFCSPSPREIATSVGQTLDRRMANDQRFKRKYENLYEAEKIGGVTIYDRRKT